MTDLTALADEIANDPLGRGYAAMNRDAIVASLNAVDRAVNRDSMTGTEIGAAIDPAEYNALTDAGKDRVIGLVSRDSVDPFGFAATVMIDVFGGGSATVTALASARTKTISRAQEIGYRRVKYGWVEAVE